MGWEGQDKIYFFNYIVHIIYDVAIICKINFNNLFQKFFSIRSEENIKNRMAAESNLCVLRAIEDLSTLLVRGALGAALPPPLSFGLACKAKDILRIGQH